MTITTYDPINPVTNRPFTRGNADRLATAASESDYASTQWATFNQWKTAGRIVRKGEHGTRCLLPVIERTADGEDVATGRIRKSFTVFNLEQTEELS